MTQAEAQAILEAEFGRLVVLARSTGPRWSVIAVRDERMGEGVTLTQDVNATPEQAIAEMRLEFDHVWWWRARPPFRVIDRKGMRCRVDARGGKGTVRVVFPDGFRVFTSRHAVRLARTG